MSEVPNSTLTLCRRVMSEVPNSYCRLCDRLFSSKLLLLVVVVLLLFDVYVQFEYSAYARVRVPLRLLAAVNLVFRLIGVSS